MPQNSQEAKIDFQATNQTFFVVKAIRTGHVFKFDYELEIAKLTEVLCNQKFVAELILQMQSVKLLFGPVNLDVIKRLTK